MRIALTILTLNHYLKVMRALSQNQAALLNSPFIQTVKQMDVQKISLYMMVLH